ncbi:MAG: hypothetical protein ACREA8_00325, partial [Nitrosotalea sp.]
LLYIQPSPTYISWIFATMGIDTITLSFQAEDDTYHDGYISALHSTLHQLLHLFLSTVALQLKNIN